MKRLNKRSLFAAATLLAVFAVLTVMAGCHLKLEVTLGCDLHTEDLAEKAKRIHREAIVIDTHADTPSRFENPEYDFSQRGDNHVTIPKMREGGLDVEFFVCYMGQWREGQESLIPRAIRRIDAIHQTIEQHNEDIVLATTVAEIRKAHAEGKLVGVVCVEGGHIIESDLDALRTFYKMGARYMTLTHSFHHDWADAGGYGAEPMEPRNNGLTEFGKDVVREMNKLGMMVDISHVSDKTFWHALEVSQAPLIATHSSCRALTPTMRNMSDEMIKAMAKKGGIIQICFGNSFIRYDDKEPSVSVIVDHIEHAIKVAGRKHVGLGADWDGTGVPEDISDCSHLEKITLELLKRGHNEKTVKGILGENLLRVMEKVEKVAAKLQRK